ncbi:hypothetical protein DXG01_008158 [Tephrocybe rancida]|nr:hypothetical protein DXG01_008158 [Tephrocybe rancida]
MPPLRDPSWGYFFTDNQFFRNNHSNKNAWCIACLDYERNRLKSADIMTVSLDGAQPYTDDEIEAQEVKRQAEAWKAEAAAKPAPQTIASLMTPHPHFLTHSRSLPGTLYTSQLSSPSPSTLSPVGTPHISSSLFFQEPTSGSSHSGKKQRLDLGASSPVIPIAWNSGLQEEFNTDLCRMLVSTKSAWNLVHNVELRLFFNKWIPGSVVPDLRTLSGPVLDKEAARVEDKLKQKLQGKKATLQTDGWKNKAKQSIVATMASVDFEPYLMRTHDTSAAPKTGEALLELITSDIKWSEDKYGLEFIAACADDGGDARKMRRLLSNLLPWLIVILCWAHQINLIVGDYLKLKAGFLDCVPQAQQVVTWMNSHSRALGIFQDHQRQSLMKKVLALIRPVITRWTAHYCSLRHLLDVKASLVYIWKQYSALMIKSAGPKHEAKAMAEYIREIIYSEAFWFEVKM